MHAQDSTHVITVKDITPKKSFFENWGGTFTIAPHFSNEMGVGVAMSYACAKPVTFIGNFTSKGYLLLGANGSAWSRSRKWKFNYGTCYNYGPSYFWGLGYEAANATVTRTKYHRVNFYLQTEFLYNFTEHFSFGPTAGYEFVKWKDIPGWSPRSSTLYAGLAAIYDSRDFAPNPHKGIYGAVRQRTYSNLSGSTSFQLNSYSKVWNGGILASEIYTIFTYGNVDATMLPTIGGTNRMRGYRYGRYMDNNIISAQLELRQKIWKMIGGTVWGGFANLWGDYSKFNIAHTLPNYGIGARCEITERINLRFDYGFGKGGQNAFIFSINEAF